MFAATALLPLAAPSPAAAAEITVFAAASLKNALDEAGERYEAETGDELAISYAASSALARQIEQGAPADVFLSADLAWMDYLEERDLVRADTRVNLLGNAIVLISGNPDAEPVEIGPGFDLAGLLGEGRLAMGGVDSVPAGRYGKAALESLGVWNSVADRLAQAENVRAALLLVSRGEAPYGIVYQTDAAADEGVRVVGTFPDDSHPPIVYPVAVTTEAEGDAAPAFVDFLATDAAGDLFEKHGFVFLNR